MLFDIERILLFFSKGIFEGNLLHFCLFVPDFFLSINLLFKKDNIE